MEAAKENNRCPLCDRVVRGDANNFALRDAVQFYRELRNHVDLFRALERTYQENISAL